MRSRARPIENLRTRWPMVLQSDDVVEVNGLSWRRVEQVDETIGQMNHEFENEYRTSARRNSQKEGHTCWAGTMVRGQE